MRWAATVPASSRPAASSVVRRATATSPPASTDSRGRDSASATSRSEGPKLWAPCDQRPGSKAPGSVPKPIRSNSSSGELRRDRSANSSMTRPSSSRWIEDRTRGTASEMNPGAAPGAVDRGVAGPTGRLDPVPGLGVHAPGWWNSPRVVTMFAPDARSRHTSPMSHARGMYSTQSAPRAEDLVEVDGGEHPGGTETAELAGVAARLVRRVDVRVRPVDRSGCSITSRRERAPMLPVAHWTTR